MIAFVVDMHSITHPLCKNTERIYRITRCPITELFNGLVVRSSGYSSISRLLITGHKMFNYWTFLCAGIGSSGHVVIRKLSHYTGDNDR
jgi:hypothetical protein